MLLLLCCGELGWPPYDAVVHSSSSGRVWCERGSPSSVGSRPPPAGGGAGKRASQWEGELAGEERKRGAEGGTRRIAQGRGTRRRADGVRGHRTPSSWGGWSSSKWSAKASTSERKVEVGEISCQLES